MNNYIIISHINITPVLKDICKREKIGYKYDGKIYKSNITLHDYSNAELNITKRRKDDEEPYRFAHNNHGTHIIRYRPINSTVYFMLANDCNYAKGIYMSRVVSKLYLEHAYSAFGHLFHKSYEDMYFHSNEHRFYDMETMTINEIKDIKLNDKQEILFNTICDKILQYKDDGNININIKNIPKKEEKNYNTINMLINQNTNSELW